MTAAVSVGSGPARQALRGINRLFRRRRLLGLGATLTPAVAWLVFVYVASLVLLVTAAFFRLDGFTGKPTSDLTMTNLVKAFTVRDFLNVVWRSALVAATVTALCLVIALPAAFYIAKVAKPWARRGLVVAMLLPLWAGYLVKGYAWKAMLRPASEFGVDKNGGFLNSVIGWTPGLGRAAVVLALAYLWLPFMMLPIYAGLERLSPTLLEASSDLGAKPWRTFSGVVMPLLLPSVAAGSIFTFSLSLGDYITPRIVAEGNFTMIGTLISTTLLAPNQPLAAAYTLWPLLIIVVYLLAMRRLGAFENL